MKRKIIKQGHNTLTITLPAKWISEKNVKAGDEIDIVEKDGLLIIDKEASPTEKKISLDISGLDRCSILYTIRNCYRLGFDEINLYYSNKTAIYYRKNIEVYVIDAIKYELSNLIGLEIIGNKSNSVILKDISNPKVDDFHNILRRIFLIMNEAGDELFEGVIEKDNAKIESLKEKHDIITKFSSYCLRMLAKFGNNINSNSDNLYHIISTIDKTADFFKIVSRDIIKSNVNFSNIFKEEIKLISDSIRLYSKIFFKLDNQLIIEFNKNKSEYTERIKQKSDELSKTEIMILKELEPILEIISELIISKIGLNLEKNN
jgi:phosphate uptake regulator